MTISLYTLDRPRKKNKAAANSATNTAPMTMPAMAPSDSWLRSLTLAAEGEDEGDITAVSDPGVLPSAGHGSPGGSWKGALMAACRCISIEVPFAGLITPTIPFGWHEARAVQ